MENTFSHASRAHSVAPLWRSLFTRQRVLGCCIVTLIGLGVFLRLHAFGLPGMLFDEHHFVENARNYTHRSVDSNDHPPLGKLVIAGSILAFGDHAFAWRVPALVAGLLLLVLGAWTSARLFRSALAGWLAAALLSADGFFIGYSRAALLDGFLALSGIVALFLCTVPWNKRRALVGGVLCGAAAGIKFTGGAVLVPMVFSIAICGSLAWRRVGLVAILLVGAASTYFAQFAMGLWIAHQPAGVLDVIRATAILVERHAGATAMKNPLTSSWPTWALPRRPLLLGYEVRGTNARALSAMGNLATWWASVGVALSLSARTLWRGAAAALDGAPERDRSFSADHGRAMLLTLTTALAFLAPWVLTHRDSYIYHFLPSYAALVLLLSGYLAWLWNERPRVVLTFLFLVLAVAIFYAPVWSFFRLKIAYVHYRLPFATWR